jgi:hypothetical protein
MPTTTAVEQELTGSFNESTDTEGKPKPALRSIREIIKDLSKPIAQKHLRKRRQGGKEIIYLAWHDAVKYLDHFAPGWCYEIRSIDSVSGKLIMIVRLSIPTTEGIIYREATGQEDEDLESYGNSSSNSESMALRRAASKFGLGLYLYDQNK